MDLAQDLGAAVAVAAAGGGSGGGGTGTGNEGCDNDAGTSGQGQQQQQQVVVLVDHEVLSAADSKPEVVAQLKEAAAPAVAAGLSLVSSRWLLDCIGSYEQRPWQGYVWMAA
jgi:hypothetical protein